MVYPTPGFIVRQTFLEFEDPKNTNEKARGCRRVLSDSDLSKASNLVSLYGSEDLRLYCEGGAAPASGEQGRRAEAGPAEAAAALPIVAEEQRSEGDAAKSEEHPSTGASSNSNLQGGCCEEERTTLLLENIPVSYTRHLLLDTLNAEGFMACYDFVYLPMDLLTMTCSGYAFVNFRTHEDARLALQHFNGFARWRVEGGEACGASWSSFCQGLDAHIERYRNSPVMHEKVPDICKPMLFGLGAPAPFPAPTKRVRVPRVRGKTSTRQRFAGAERAKACSSSRPAEADEQPLVAVCG